MRTTYFRKSSYPRLAITEALIITIHNTSVCAIGGICSDTSGAKAERQNSRRAAGGRNRSQRH